MRKRYVNHSVSIDVDIIEFDDDAIVDACVASVANSLRRRRSGERHIHIVR